MKKTLILAALSTTAFPVWAADPVIPDPVLAPPVIQVVPLWSGIYVGGQLGWSRGQRSASVPARPVPVPVQPPFTPPSIDEVLPETPPASACDPGGFAFAGAATSNTSAIAWADPCTALGLAGTTKTNAAAIAAEQGSGNTQDLQESVLLAEDTDAALQSDGTGDDLIYTAGSKRDSFIGGVHVGYNYQFDNNLVVGAVADINFLKWERYLGVTDGTHSLRREQSLDYLGTVRAKLGYAADRVLVYASGGLAYGGLKTEFLLDDVRFDGERKVLSGYAVGAGIDVMVFDNVSIGAEYLYTDLGRKFEDVTFHSVFVKAAYHFR